MTTCRASSPPPVDLDAAINDVCAVADAVKARKRSDKVMQLSLDEWNVWYLSRLLARPAPTEWEQAPRLSEDDYTVADAVVVGNLLVSMLRRADRVKMACLAQLVNTIATIRADPGTPAWRQTTFYPFSLTARHAQGDVLTTRVTSTPLETTKHGTVAQLDAVATVDGSSVALFLVNRSAGESVDVAVDLRGFGPYEVVEHVVLSDPDPMRTNTPEQPNSVVPVPGASRVEGGKLVVTMPAVAWSMVRLELT